MKRFIIAGSLLLLTLPAGAHQTLVDGVRDLATQITDLSTFVAVNCRLIDTSTGQVFGAAKATLKAGVHGRYGEEPYSPMDIAKLMALRDQLGRNTDDPADGIWAKATSMGEGGMNVTFGPGGNTSPEQFFRFRGNTFIVGTPTTIAPGQSVTVTMTFRPEESSDTSATAFQFQGELVVGSTRRGYVLDTVTFDRVSISESVP